MKARNKKEGLISDEEGAVAMEIAEL